MDQEVAAFLPREPFVPGEWLVHYAHYHPELGEWVQYMNVSEYGNAVVETAVERTSITVFHQHLYKPTPEQLAQFIAIKLLT